MTTAWQWVGAAFSCRHDQSDNCAELQGTQQAAAGIYMPAHTADLATYSNTFGHNTHPGKPAQHMSGGLVLCRVPYYADPWCSPAAGHGSIKDVCYIKCRVSKQTTNLLASACACCHPALPMCETGCSCSCCSSWLKPQVFLGATGYAPSVGIHLKACKVHFHAAHQCADNSFSSFSPAELKGE
jgi:hypothetical protein